MTQLRIRTTLTLLLLMAFSTATVAQDSHCQLGIGEDEASTPSDEFELPRDGTVIHVRTDLQWAQCALGQGWSRDSCTGQAESMTWSEAQTAIDELNRTGELGGYTDWRLPTREELETIVEKCREAPAINDDIFPDTPWAGFWTSSLDTEEEGDAWFIGFYYGLTLEYSRDSSYRVRPVRYR
ncbi:Lcl C-terminal domain-containing protein [Wenzhouxiangella marina]|uniref:Lcl C-terminal domain-containing protein n=1 Tax=Wenzhouxiangella marina TaxID=1579979 RepID=A0A0K0XYA3_9GAMM|nr:DUF1566 domain-containing protein [Wenzhouxiangella marina]AKS42612.1 hypothetical protein WM2015_2249 [Wenzhouxiangella marina]MBB6085606.1 hypothetical protein [Wenzhouxiangella marina]